MVDAVLGTYVIRGVNCTYTSDETHYYCYLKIVFRRKKKILFRREREEGERYSIILDILQEFFKNFSLHWDYLWNSCAETTP